MSKEKSDLSPLCLQCVLEVLKSQHNLSPLPYVYFTQEGHCFCKFH